MPRRTSSRLRGGTAALCEEGGGAGGLSDGDSSGGGGVVCPPPPPSPGKRKARSPIHEDHGFAGLAHPNPVRCAAFQSPKKRAQGFGDRSGGPFDKENDTGAGFSAPVLGEGVLRLSAHSAFSQHASAVTTPTWEQGRGGWARRSREDLTGAAISALHSPAAGTPSTPRVPTAGSAAAKGAMLPFLLAPASVTKSPDLRRKTTSRRATRSRGTNSNSSSGSTSSSSSGVGSGGGGGGGGGRGVLRRSRDTSNPPVPAAPSGAVAAAIDSSSPFDPPASTPRKARYPVRSWAGCAAGRRRPSREASTGAAAAAAVLASSAESASAASPTEGKNTGGGGPAGSHRRVVGGARLGPGGGGGCGTISDHSPHRSPSLDKDNIHRLTESLQKWDPGSRYASPADDHIGEGGDAGTGGAAGVAGVGAGARSGASGMKEVGASWSGQEFRGTLEKERMRRGRRRRHSVTSAEDMYPQGTHGRFGDHSPISPASSVASIHMGGFDACTPASAGRPWRSSPRRAEGGRAVSGVGSRRMAGGGVDGAGAGDVEGTGSAEHFGIVRMEGSWSEDEAGPSGAAMRLDFSPGGRGSTPRATVTAAAGAAAAVAGVAGARAAGSTTIPRIASWQYTFSPEKGQEAMEPPGNGHGAPFATEPDLSASPEQHHQLLHSMRDLIDHGTDDEDEDEDEDEEGRGGGEEASLVRRRRRRPRPELALRSLEMPDLMDLSPGEDENPALTTASEAAGMDSRVSPATTTTCSSTSSTSSTSSAGKGLPNPLVSPAFTGKRLGGDDDGDGAGVPGSGCNTTCRRWGGSAPSADRSSYSFAHGTPKTVADADDAWRGERGGKGNGGDWGGAASSSALSSSGFGLGARAGGRQDVSDGAFSAFSEHNTSGETAVAGMSGLADTSSASEASTSFVKSRPIPDQSAFGSSRLSGPHSPLGIAAGSGGSSNNGGPAPAPAPAPVCLTPRKSMMRCPPTPQRTPTWDGLEDSLLLEGAGSGGRSCGGGFSPGFGSRSCLRQSKLLASSDERGDIGGGGGNASGMAIDAALTNSSSVGASRRTSPRFETAAANGAAASSGSGGGAKSGCISWEASRTGGGRRGRGRGGRYRSSAGGTRSSGGRGDAVARGACASSGGGGSGAGAGSGVADSTLGFKHDFVQMGPIGEGGFSVVWKVRAKGTGKMYAIKRSKREFRGRRDRDRCLLEARALQRLGQHPGVLRFERAWQEEGHFCLQTELCELGTLKDFLERLPSRREIPEAAVWQVLQDVGQALRHVHAMGLVHLDVKPANLLIGDEGGRLKLADFGMATAYGEGVEGIGDGQEGDTLYMAKELLSSTARLPSADMFSLGLTVYEVATRMELPGDGEYWHALRDGTAVGLPSSRSQELGAVLRQLMHPDPRQRPTADELCEHPRVANVTGSSGSSSGSRNKSTAAAGAGTGAAMPMHERDDFVVSQARAWRAAEVKAMDHPSSGLRTPTGETSARYTFQQTGQ